MVTAWVAFEKKEQIKMEKTIVRFTRKFRSAKIPLTAIANHFFNENTEEFLKKPGRFKDLTPKYKSWKEKKLGSAYPIHVFSGRFRDSMTKQNDPDAVLRITDTSLVMGSKVKSKKGFPYPVVLDARTEGEPIIRKDKATLQSYLKIFWRTALKMARAGWRGN